MRRLSSAAAPAALLLAGLAGCNRDPGFVGVAGVRAAEAAEVAQCAYVSDIRGTPSVFGPLADQGVKYMRNQIMADARDAGANTVVFDKVSPGTAVYELHAVAYRC